MNDRYVIGVANSVMSKGPVPSGLMLEGSAHLAGSLHAAGYRPRIFDFNTVHAIRKIAENGERGKEIFLRNATEQLHEELQRTGAKLLFFTLYSNGFPDNVEIATELKSRNPGLIVAAGGPLVSWFEEEIYGYTGVFDVLVRGKGDEAIARLADHVYRGEPDSKIPGAIFKDGRKNPKEVTDVLKLPIPLYDKEVYVGLDGKIMVSTLRTTVGCRYARCEFCAQPKIDGPYRERDIADVLHEVETLRSRYGIRNFRLSDPNPSPRHLKEFFSGLPGDVKVSCFAYSDQEYDFSSVGDHLIGIFIGIEGMDSATLLKLRKTSDPEAYLKACKKLVEEARNAGISTVHANIVPVRDDTRERISRQAEQVAALGADFITALPESPIPKTGLYYAALKQPEKFGMRLNPDYLRKFMLYELDLLKPMPPMPFQLRVDGEFVDPTPLTRDLFIMPLAKQGINITSDEIVLMVHLLNNGLSKDQSERRRQVLTFQADVRDAMATGNYQKLEAMVTTINTHAGGDKNLN